MIDKIKSRIEEANISYRKGEPIMSDSEYDELIEKLSELSPNDELLTKVGLEVDSSRKSKLPIEMASMNKIKTIDDIFDWTRLKSISNSELVVITPKYDGLSLCVNEETENAFTRGNGVYGQKSDNHYQLMNNQLNPLCNLFSFTYGEVIMKKDTFLKKYSTDFANPRNLVAGLLNSKTPSNILSDCDYIKYGAISKKEYETKKELLDNLNANQDIKVPFHVCTISSITEELLMDLFNKYSLEYEIDGLIIELNSLSNQKSLGRETSSNNPVWARAYKNSNFEQSEESEVLGISWNISKNGLLKPIVHINPIRLDGVTVSNVTGNNAKFIKTMGIGVGAKVLVKRSGMVIPLIVKVTKKVEFKMPVLDGVEVIWNNNGIELMTKTETDSQKLKKNIAFFEILEADNVSKGVIKQLWDAGYKSIKDILSLTKDDLSKIDRFGKRKSEIVYNSIQNSVKNVQLSKLQHATGLFSGLGSKKLALLENFKTKPSIDDIVSIEGFAEKSAKVYVESYDKFFDFIKDLPITILEKSDINSSSATLKDMAVVFTGIRLKDKEKILTENGAKVVSSVSKNTTHIVCKDPSANSSKLKKGRLLGVKIITVKELDDIIDSL